MLRLQGIDKSYSGRRVLRDVSFSVPAGSITVLLGPSGCGKTTLLRVVAGLEAPDAGRVVLDERDLAPVPTHQRGIGLVFQDYALFPHMSVADNVAFGLHMAGWDEARANRRAAEALAWVGLAGFGARDPVALSGGEQQRVALARSLAPAPRLLLLDEPLGALDRALRERLLAELRAILAAAGDAMGYPAGITALYVTHDQAEAFALADQIAVMREGAVVQLGAPREVYRRPAGPFVARFLGLTNLLPGVVRAVPSGSVTTAIGDVAVKEAPDLPVGAAVTLLLRPDAAVLDAPQPDRRPDLSAVVVRRTFRGRYQALTVQPAQGPPLRFEFDPNEDLPAEGETVALFLRPDRLLILPAQDLPD